MVADINHHGRALRRRCDPVGAITSHGTKDSDAEEQETACGAWNHTICRGTTRRKIACHAAQRDQFGF
jgi:hypothetical protein